MSLCDCGNEMPEENKGRVCAYQVDDLLNYNGAIFCNCCDICRAECHAALIEQTQNNE